MNSPIGGLSGDEAKNDGQISGRTELSGPERELEQLLARILDPLGRLSLITQVLLEKLLDFVDLEGLG
jgi:hypothetical protein